MSSGPVEGSPASVEPVPGGLDATVLADVMAASQDGMAVLDEHRRFLLVNPEGCRILDATPEDLLGRPAFSEWTAHEPADEAAGQRSGTEYVLTQRTRDEPICERELECRQSSFTAGGRRFPVVTFREQTEFRRQQRRIAAFAVAASRVAYAGSLRATLDAICAEVLRTAGLAGVQIVLIKPDDQRIHVYGAAPQMVFPEKFALLLHEARQRGAQLSSLRAYRDRRPVITRHRQAQMLADPAWQPLHDHLRGFEWDTFVSVPLVARDRPLGAMNAYYLPGQDPDDEDVRFLTSMADQAAVAADNARLFAELKGKAELEERHRLARELHDSACQELFSMNLHIRAAKLVLARHAPAADDGLSRHLATIEELAHAALEDMRALVVELYPTLLHSEGLLTAVRQHAASVCAREGLQVTVHAEQDRIKLDAGSELEAYRLVQEALHNTVKHAQAKSVDIRIGPDPSDEQTLVLEVVDDGSGFDSAAVGAGRLGLASMRERAERLGGELAITSSPGMGTTVRVVVPRTLGRPTDDARDAAPVDTPAATEELVPDHG